VLSGGLLQLLAIFEEDRANLRKRLLAPLPEFAALLFLVKSPLVVTACPELTEEEFLCRI
jgi:hypothetical protein